MNAKVKVELNAVQAKKVETLTSVSAKIRYLNTQQFTRMQIANLLGKRYQHVRNVLEDDIRTGKK